MSLEWATSGDSAPAGPETRDATNAAGDDNGDGRAFRARSGRKVQSINPATNQVLAEFDAAEVRDVQAAVADARRAAPAWRALGPGGRARYLVRLKEALFRRRHDLAALITREAGKPRL